MLGCRRHKLNIWKAIVACSRNSRRPMCISFIYPVISGRVSMEKKLKVTLSFNFSVLFKYIPVCRNTVAFLNFLLLFSGMFLDLLVFSIKAFSIKCDKRSIFFISLFKSWTWHRNLCHISAISPNSFLLSSFSYELIPFHEHMNISLYLLLIASVNTISVFL